MLTVTRVMLAAGALAIAVAFWQNLSFLLFGVTPMKSVPRASPDPVFKSPSKKGKAWPLPPHGHEPLAYPPAPAVSVEVDRLHAELNQALFETLRPLHDLLAAGDATTGDDAGQKLGMSVALFLTGAAPYLSLPPQPCSPCVCSRTTATSPLLPMLLSFPGRVLATRQTRCSGPRRYYLRSAP